jgi:integrase
VLKRFSSLDHKRVGNIAPDDVQAVIDRMKTSTARDEVVQRFSNLIRFLKRRIQARDWPVDQLERRRVPIYRDHVLEAAELKSVLGMARSWHARAHSYGGYGCIIELLILTGQRRGKIGGLRRSYTDFGRDIITWPPPEMKSKRPHMIPLGGTVRVLLGQRGGGDLYFPNRYGGPATFVSNLDRQFKKEYGVDGWVSHDLRRSLATCWQAMGVPLEVTERMLDHSRVTGGLVGIYQRHNYLVELRAAVEKWENGWKPIVTNNNRIAAGRTSGVLFHSSVPSAQRRSAPARLSGRRLPALRGCPRITIAPNQRSVTSRK